MKARCNEAEVVHDRRKRVSIIALGDTLAASQLTHAATRYTTAFVSNLPRSRDPHIRFAVDLLYVHRRLQFTATPRQSNVYGKSAAVRLSDLRPPYGESQC